MGSAVKHALPDGWITPARPWETVVAEKRKQQQAAIERFEATYNDGEMQTVAMKNSLNVTAISEVSELTTAISSLQKTAEEVAKAYITRAIEIHAKTNCLTEILFYEAIAQAQELDRHLAETGKLVGPLHGVPVTLKDQFDVKDHDSTLGYVGLAFQPAEIDGVVVRMLKSLGAVIIAKTNLPQSIMWCETDNPLFGLTTNPTNKNYTPGGSTGGEGALLSCQGSLLGWGTDIGGSIRIPSHMNGIYGFKPSSARLSYRGVAVSTDGQEHVPSSIGPMARSLSTIHLATKSLIDLEPWTLDARCAPIPWRQSLYSSTLTRPLVIGLLLDDGVVEPHPPITSTLLKAVALLKAAGHHVVEWDCTLHAEAIEVMDAYYTVDGGEDIRRAVASGGESWIPQIERLAHKKPAISVYEYWQLNKRKREVQNGYLDKWRGKTVKVRDDNGVEVERCVDVLLMPPMPHAAVPHGKCKWVGYTKIWNLLDYTALVIPAGRVGDGGEGDRELERKYASGEARGEKDTWNRKVWEEHGDEMKEMKLPVGVQIVGQRLEEEKVLAVGKVLDDLLRAGRT